MSTDLGSPPDARISQILDMVSHMVSDDQAEPERSDEQGDLLDRIIDGLSQASAAREQQQAAEAQAERQSQEILDVMFAAAAQDYSQRAPVGDDDTLLDALATGLNMLLDELVASQVSTLHLQQEIIRTQDAALRELSTPLIPIADQVVVMPLIGSLDSRRTQQVIETLLEGVSTLRARVAIIDITGVPVVDTQVANTLVRAAQSVKLLGAKVILTGIRPEVAQTLVGLGADLSSIITRGTLQSGIALALRNSR
ncbi:STAS domain-containing protein [Oscillochloris sp. ZM17-4]|nr:STAS domain-containing protein [Oscillochloris sp. ZM17-4]MBX0326121.1 STAS domain-containing protein [Oscillochloris sp. ZM17-4]